MSEEFQRKRHPSPEVTQPGGQAETPPARTDELIEPESSSPDAGPMSDSGAETPPAADPANWLDHED